MEQKRTYLLETVVIPAIAKFFGEWIQQVSKSKICHLVDGKRKIH